VKVTLGEIVRAREVELLKKETPLGQVATAYCPSRTVGIEIEVADHEVVKTRGEVESLRDVASCYDGSISGGGEAIEYNSPPLRYGEVESWVYYMTQRLASAGGSVNNSCGLHVHVDIRDYDPENLVALSIVLFAAQKRLFGMSGNRQGNRYCAEWTVNTVLDIKDMARRGMSIEDIAEAMPTRYLAFNLKAFNEHGTIEFRLHEGTLDPAEITGWCRLLRDIVDTCSGLTNFQLSDTESVEEWLLRNSDSHNREWVLTALDKKVAEDKVRCEECGEWIDVHSATTCGECFWPSAETIRCAYCHERHMALGIHLDEFDNVQTDTSSSNFSGRDMRGWDFEGADLDNSNFCRANLIGARVNGASLRGSHFVEAELIAANFQFSNLSGADLFGANLRQANFEAANLSHANLESSYLESANLNAANATDASFYGAHLEGLDAVSACFAGADLRGADLRGANLEGADLSNANLLGADLRMANLRRANLGYANLRDANLGGADLRGTWLEGEDLSSLSVRSFLSEGVVQ